MIMNKEKFSKIDIVKKRLGKQGNNEWDDVFEQMAMSARDFIVSQIGWEIQEHEATEFVDGYGEKPVILSRGHMTDLKEFAIHTTGTNYEPVDLSSVR